jgi:hypothetical protein
MKCGRHKAMITQGLKLPFDDTCISSDLKRIANIISCKCGCGKTRLDRDKNRCLREYILGHNSRGRSNKIPSTRRENHWNWKGGRYMKNGYWLILKPNHPRADKDDYIGEHILKMEKKIGRYLRWYERVHHKDKDPSNNRLSNLQLTTICEHNTLHRRDYGQICTKCGSEDVNRNGYGKCFSVILVE